MIISTQMYGHCTIRIHDDYIIRDRAELEKSVDSLREILHAAAARIEAESRREKESCSQATQTDL